MRQEPKALEIEESDAEGVEVAVRRVFIRMGWLGTLLVPALAVLTALIIGGLIVLLSNAEATSAWGKFFQDPLYALTISWTTLRIAYTALLEGSLGNPATIAKGIATLRATGENRELLEALRPLGESLAVSTPYILAGLSVTLGLRGGVFNIGAEGQLFVGGLAAAFVGYSMKGLPWIVHMPLTLAAGIAAGLIWGGIPGILKARTGAHEVINTIMMNWIAFRLTDYLLTGPMARPDKLPITPEILPTAYFPALLPKPVRLHWGFFVALGVAALVYWFLWKTTRGFEIRMTGANPRGARYAGVKTNRIIAWTMALAGGLGGMAGAVQVMGVDHRMVRAFSSGFGFDAIALALLGNSHPVGVVLASLLFGFLRAGAARMQSVANVPAELIRVIQGLVILFVAAPAIVRGLYRLKAARPEEAQQMRGWGS